MDTAVPGHPRPARISTASLCCRHLPSRSGRPRRYFPLPDHKTSWARRHGGVSPGRGQRWAVPPTRASWRGRLTSCPASRHDPRPRSPAHRRRRARTPGRGPNLSGTSAPLGLAIGKHASRKQRPGPPASAIGGGPPFHLRPGQPHPCRVRHGARTGPPKTARTRGRRSLAPLDFQHPSVNPPAAAPPSLPTTGHTHGRQGPGAIASPSRPPAAASVATGRRVAQPRGSTRLPHPLRCGHVSDSPINALHPTGVKCNHSADFRPGPATVRRRIAPGSALHDTTPAYASVRANRRIARYAHVPTVSAPRPGLQPAPRLHLPRGVGCNGSSSTTIVLGPRPHQWRAPQEPACVFG